MIELLGVSKAYDSLVALHPLDLHIETGKTTVLIGPSGCGKSTLLRIITGLVTPTSGRVFIQDQPLTAQNLIERRRSMGYVIQEGGLFAHLTARGNVTLMARYLRWPRERIAGRAQELAELVRLPADGLDRYPTELSGGQRQRVSLMRALMLDPAILLLDEPLAALDPLVRFDLQTDLKQIFEKLGKTVVLVTHDIAEAAFFGGVIVLMRDGRIVQQGTPRDLVERPAEEFVARFVNAQRRLPDLIGRAP
ncbi:MAG TPA: ATP-binding cassette domain-containing protein [Tepidisphaeraceae bacterium]|jgi:osmoprotectant transport system ATP-binding protein|nr:ATP-binding cassette domain-containing protein [Tepidisphaeraceae bacterium]